jgi:hypothetical protein
MNTNLSYDSNLKVLEDIREHIPSAKEMRIMINITSINTFLCLISKIRVFLKSNRYKLLLIFEIYGALSFDNTISRKAIYAQYA